MKNTEGARKGRPGAVRQGSKGKQVGSGGQGRQALEGKKPTPKAEDRPYHPAGKRKLANDRLEAARSRSGGAGGRTGSGVVAGRGRQEAPRRRPGQADDHEMVTGRNSVLEALRTRIPATALYVAARIEMDDRVRDILALATRRGVPVMEVMRPELDRLTGPDSVHQGVAIKVPPYEYRHPEDLLEASLKRQQTPLFVALDGITDPRNLGAIIRSTGAFGGHGIILPQRRSAGVNSAAWKTSAGAAARVPVALATNLTTQLKEFKKQGVFVLGLDGDGDVLLPELQLAVRPVVIVTGSEGKGLSRLVAETCDQIVSIPISAVTESLNAGIATSVALYQVSTIRTAKK